MCFLMRFGHVPTSQLHSHVGTTAATPLPTPAAKSSHGYNGSVLIFIGRRDTKYDQDSIPNLPNYN
jgi:hypothetical protein